jgi:streptogrisin B
VTTSDRGHRAPAATDADAASPRIPTGHRIGTYAAIAATAAALAVAGAAPAAAERTPTVSPGDALVTTAAEGGQTCTLGYTFTNRSTGVTYGITAGHCNGHRSAYVTDGTTGAIGHFVLAVANPDEIIDDDYGLIDFGAARSVPLMHGMPVSGISQPNPDTAVCHDGIRTGVACGTITSRYFGSQYITSGMPRSIPGDSGGPVWQLAHDDTATVIGVWLGEHNDPDGSHYGRFTALADVLADITDYAGPSSST